MIREDAVDALVERAHREIDEGILPSCQLAIAYDGDIVREITLGDAPAGGDTRYTIYSSTKAVVASVVWQLLAEDKLSLDDRVADHIPEFGTNGKDVVTVEQVLLHTSGFPRGPLGPPQWDTREGRLAAFSKWRLNWEPGTRHEYHATTADWVLAELLARADGCEHTESLRRRVLDPLGMKKLALGVPLEQQHDIARVVHTGEPPTPAELEAAIGVSELDVGEVTDEALESFNRPDVIAVGVPGGGGVSTAGELALFYQALLHNPDGLWDPKWLATATGDVRNSFPDPLLRVPANRSIGLVLYGDDGKGTMRGFGHGQSPSTFGHDGAGGQLAWADPTTGISFAYLTNGLDRNVLRQWRRSIGINSRAEPPARRRPMKPLSGMDVSFLYMETPSQLAHVVAVIVLDPTEGAGFSFERVLDILQTRLHLLPPFRRRLVPVPFDLGHPVWIEDPDFDLEAHIHRGAVRAPGTMSELAEVVDEIAAVPLDRSRPLWELHLLEGLEHGKVGFVTKIHHSTIDGVTGTDLLANLFDLTPDAPDPEPPDELWQPEQVPSDLDLVTYAMQHILRRPRTMAKVFGNTVRSVFDIVQRQRDATAEHRPSPALPFTAPKVRWSGAITPHRSVAFGKASLDDMRRIKTAFGTTVNDVVLAACTQTLREYLIAHDDLPDTPLVCSVPVSVHGRSDHDGTNQVSTMFVRLPVQTDDPVEQLRTIAAETREAKEVQNAIGADMLQDFAQFVPPTLFNRAMRAYSDLNLADRHRPVHNLIVSNVPGPPIPLYIAGAEVVGVYPFGPLLEGAGLNLTVLSHMGQVDVGVIGCRELVPDVWDIADGFVDAVLHLDKRAAEAADTGAPG